MRSQITGRFYFGIVMCKGLPIAHYIFRGNICDKKTLGEVLRDLERRFGLGRVIIVADRGITTFENIEKITGYGYEYILGVSLRKSRIGKKILKKMGDLECKEATSGIRYVEFREGEDKWILVLSEERARYEREMRNKLIEKDVWEPEKIEGREMEGRYLLRSRADMPAKEIIRAYKDLWEIESAFREIKNFIKIRPIYHKTEERVRAHIFIAVLAYLIEKVIHKIAREKGLNMSARDIIEFSKKLKVMEVKVGDKIVRFLS